MKLLALPIVFSWSLFAAQSAAPTFDDLASRASAARESNDVARAIELYQEALRLNLKWEEGWWFLGSLLYDADKYAESRNALSHVVELDPKAAPAWGLLGLCEYETAYYDQSLTHIQRSLSLGGANQPQMDRVLRYHKALLLTRAGDFDRAIQEYSPLVRDGSQDPSILTSIGLAALRTSLLPKEVPESQHELFLNAGKASFYTMTGDFQSAQRAYHDLLERFPTSINVHYLYGCFLLVSDTDRAISEFKHELQIAPSNPAAAAMLAWILLRRGEYKAALPYAEKAAQGAPKFAVAQSVLGRLLVESGAVDQGIEHLKIAEGLDPAFLETHLSLATAYSRIGKNQDARRERELSLEMVKEQNPVARQ